MDDAPHFSAGSYTTAGAVMLDEEDSDLPHRSSGLVTPGKREAPQFTAGRAFKGKH